MEPNHDHELDRDREDPPNVTAKREEGYAAFNAGKLQDDNPYDYEDPDEKEDHLNWEYGFVFGDEDNKKLRKLSEGRVG